MINQNPEPPIVLAAAKNMLGYHQSIHLARYHIATLWQRLLPVKDQLKSDAMLISVAVYPSEYFLRFDPNQNFIRWVGMLHEGVISPSEIEKYELQPFEIESGLYAVFQHKCASKDASIFQYIYNQWLPNSSFQLDDRPHVEILSPNYQVNHPDAEEEIWIPIKPR